MSARMQGLRCGFEASPIDRKKFIERFMSGCGISYREAGTVYEVMCSIFEDGVVTGSPIRIGRIGSIQPSYRPPRTYHMHFRVEKGRRVKRGIHRTYNVDGRHEFKFKLYKAFIANHALKWFVDLPV